MRKTLLTLAATAAIGFGGVTAAAAAPMNPAPLNQASTAVDGVTTVQHWRWGSRGGHWRWGSRGRHWRWGSRGRW